MKPAARFLVALAFVSWGGNTAAAPITGADIVNVEGRHWAQVDLFTELSWNDIQTVCPGGICGPGSLNGYSMAGWELAGVEAINGLFNFYLSAAGVSGDDLLGPGPDQFGTMGGAWADDILLDFRPTWESCDPPPATCTIFELNGWTKDSTRIQQWQVGYVGTIRNRVNPFGGDGAASDRTYIPESRNSSVGGFFFRTEVVPLPSSLALSFLGLAIMAIRRKSRSRKRH